jgi:hypothetical protein
MRILSPFWPVTAAIALSQLSCSAIVDTSTTQCRTDADCARLGYGTCSSEGVCGGSGGSGPDTPLGPTGCFRGPMPSNDLDFLNQCTRAQYVKFDNCMRLGLCGDVTLPTADPPPPPMAPPDTGMLTPPSVGCYDAQERNKIIFMQGSTNFTPFIQAMAPLVARNGYVIVWQPTSSCAGAASLFDATAGKNMMRNPTMLAQTYASFYDAKGVGTPCLLGNSPASPDGTSEVTDIGESDVFASSCPLPAGQMPWIPAAGAYGEVAHYLGPIQAMVFVAPPSSTQRVISAEAARMVFGMGGGSSGNAAAPWTDPAFMYIRSSTTGTNNILSRAIDISPNKWWGIDKKTAPAMQAAVLTASAETSEKTIGTLSIDFADRVKDSLHILSFQAKGQLAGFLPDSRTSSHDKQNVRDGHYSPWGPIHLYTKLVGGQLTAQATAFILPFNVPNQALVDATIAGGSVPVCAMRVTRDQEMGPLRAFSPTFQCHCYYELKVNGGNDCTPCTGAASCSADKPACNLGFCEVD